MEKSKMDKIDKAALNCDNSKIVAIGILRFKDGNGSVEQQWTERDLFYKKALSANYEITEYK